MSINNNQLKQNINEYYQQQNNQLNNVSDIHDYIADIDDYDIHDIIVNASNWDIEQQVLKIDVHLKRKIQNICIDIIIDNKS